jgi:hypothetical protein
MANSPILDIPLLATSQAAKEDTINSMVGYLERAMNDVVTVDMDNGNLVLPDVDFVRHMTFRTTNVAFGSTLTVPTRTRTYVIDNRASSETLIVISGIGSANVPAQAVCVLHSDGTSVMIISNSAAISNSSSVGPKPNGEHEYWRFVVKTAKIDGSFVSINELNMRSDPAGIRLTTGGTALESSHYSGDVVANAYDDNVATKWTSDVGTVSTSNHWIGYQFASPVAITHIDVTVGSTANDNQPTSGVVEYSDDGVTWYEAWEVEIWTWTNLVETTNSSTHPLYLKKRENLGDLDDVELPGTPDSGATLVWNSSLERWVAGGASGGPGAEYDPHRYWRLAVVGASTGNPYIRISGIELQDALGNDLTDTEGGSAFSPVNTPSAAFDNNVNTDWDSGSLSGGEKVIGWDFGVGNEQAIAAFAFYQKESGSNLMTQFRLEYSDDGTNYVPFFEYDDTGYPILQWNVIPLPPTPYLPKGGTTGQVLKKISGDDYAVSWENEGVASINDQSASYTLVLADAGKYVRVDNASANDLTVPANASVAFDVGTIITLRQVGAGQMTVVEDTGVTVNTPETLNLRKQGSTATLIKVGTNEWDLTGDLEAI